MFVRIGSIGREIFLKQLELMQGNYKTVDWPSEADEDLCAKLAELLEVPEGMEGAFNAYCLDYIISGEEATHPNGAFYNDEDIKNGIYDKIYFFYRPIFDRIEEETKLSIAIHIEPSYVVRSYLVAVAEYYEGRKLDLSFVIYKDSFKAWWSFFSEPETPEQLPEEVYSELERIYRDAKDAVAKGLRANGIAGFDVENEKPAGILVRYTGVSGEAEFACSVLIPYDGKVPPEKAVRSYFRDFFGKGTEQEDDRWYFSEDGCRAVKVGGWEIVLQADYEVLKKCVW